MGAVLIDGDFSSSDWRNTIKSLRKQKVKELGGYYGNIDDINYSGEINTINKWSSVQVKGASIEEIEENFYKLYPNIRRQIEKWTGIVAEGSTVLGYDIYTPTFERLESLPFNYSQYVQSGKYSLLEYIPKPEIGTIAYYRGKTDSIKVLKQGYLEDVKEDAKYELYHNPHKIYVICGSNGIHYKCYMKIKRVKTTIQKSEYKKRLVKEVHNYYWVGMAGI